jgi:hypothetical protein
MDEFIVLLIIALVIIGVMVAIGTPLANWASGNWTTGGGAIGNFKILTSFDLGNVGISGNEISRNVKFGSFTLGQAQTETLKDMASVGVSQGYFGADPKKFDMNVDQNILNNLKDVKISFDMGETNLYGNLVFRWNDKVVFDGLANLNRYDITIQPQDVKEENTLGISAAGPGLYFWAATYYGLQNFKVVAEYGSEKFASFKVYPNELEAWSKGVLKFYATKVQAGDVRVKLNGQEIYSSSNPEHLVTREFEFSQIGNAIKVGDNVLSFKSSGVWNLDDVEFDVLLTSGNAVSNRYFNITKEDINLLNGKGKGRIEFNVDNIEENGVLTIRINSNQLSVQSVKSGKNTVEFASSYAAEGENTMSFSGTGSWDISSVKVGIPY